MKTRWLIVLAAAVALLGGCAAPVIRSDVTVFEQWPADMRGAPYVFVRTDAQNNDLEYRTYEGLVAAELRRLGFVESSPDRPARVRVAIAYSNNARDVRVVQPVMIDPYWGGPSYWPYYGPRWRRYYSPFYDPFWYRSPTVAYQDQQFELFTRQLKVVMSDAATGRTLHDVTVNSQGTTGSLSKVMPYLVRSAFSEFPGRNGVSRVVELEMPRE